MIGNQNLLLWRHADANINLTNDNDMARPLSLKGIQQARKMAKWLNNNLPKDTNIICSQALRAEQTAQSLNREYLVLEDLAPEAKLATVMLSINSISRSKSNSQNLLIIGHQPWLGLLAAQLLSLPQKLPQNAIEISIKKGAVWWFKRTTTDKNQAYKLHVVQTPSLL